MALSETESNGNDYIQPVYASRYMDTLISRVNMPEISMPKEVAYQIVHDELMFDGNPTLDLSSFLTTWMEPECERLMLAAMKKNFIEMDEYPVTTELQNRCVNMIARLFHADLETTIGVGTVGSSEAVMLAGLAFKRKWQNKTKSLNKPNIVAGANVHVCWEKFATYFEVDLKKVDLSDGYYVMDPTKAVEMVDENTICVVAILGSTYNGEFEDVELLNNLLIKKSQEKGWDIPIHVDAASGGFIAPFLYPNIKWDFRLDRVKSINVSGHKYGLVYPGVGWVIWRSKLEDLPRELIFDVEYVGGKQATFTLNFSKGASQIIAQYYQLIRLGREGYNNIMMKCREAANRLKKELLETERFEIISKDIGVPLVAFSLKRDDTNHPNFDEYAVSKMLRRFGWMVPAYKMPAQDGKLVVLRVVVREDFSQTLVQRFLADIQKVLTDLDNLLPMNGSNNMLVNSSEEEGPTIGTC